MQRSRWLNMVVAGVGSQGSGGVGAGGSHVELVVVEDSQGSGGVGAGAGPLSSRMGEEVLHGGALTLGTGWGGGLLVALHSTLDQEGLGT